MQMFDQGEPFNVAGLSDEANGNGGEAGKCESPYQNAFPLALADVLVRHREASATIKSSATPAPDRKIQE
jgi:hypothetical protein